MKIQELRNLIRSEVRKAINESKRKSLREGKMSSEDTEYLKDVVVAIAKQTAAGQDMTDSIIDELGDLYDAVYDTNDSILIGAFDALRQTAEEPIVQQKKAALEFLKILK